MWKTALITGGSTGIGRALAEELVARGAQVVLVARTRERLEETCREIGPSALPLTCDLSCAANAEDAVHQAQALLGPLDLVIANAGTYGGSRARTLKVSEIERVVQTNVIGACATLTAAIPGMLAQGSGNLVGISSVASFRAIRGSAIYCASKAAFSTFIEGVRLDLHGTGVHVTDVHPGYVATPLLEGKKNPPFVWPADRAAQRILRSARRGRRVDTFPWQMNLAMHILRRIPNPIYDRVAWRLG